MTAAALTTPAAPARTVTTVRAEATGALLGLLPAEGALSWVRHGEGLVGWGEAARLEVSGPDALAEAAAWWHEYTDGLDVDKLRQIATIIEPEQVADEVVTAIDEERFLILPHPEVAKYMANRGATHDRWLAGMRKLQAQLGGLERPPQ